MPPISVGVQGPGNWNRYTHRLTIPGVELVPGSTVLLVLTSQGAYANVDTGPTAGQFDAEFQLNATPVSFIDVDEVQTRIFCRDTHLERWPDPTYAGPYGAIYYSEIYDEFGTPSIVSENITVVAVVPSDAYIDITRGSPAIPHPGGQSFIIVDEPYVLTDTGNPPPLLYVPGDPTAAPARTGSWWAQVTASGTVDPGFSFWQSRYWQSAPTPSLTVPSPKLWSTLSMLGRRADGTEISNGLLTPVVDPGSGLTSYQLIVEMQGTWPTDEVFYHLGFLVVMSPTTEVLPIPEVFGDIVQLPEAAPAVPPDPRYPPFASTYPGSDWFRWISSLGMNGSDVFLPILLSQGQYDATQFPLPSIRGFRDTTGTEYDPANPDLPYDNPVPLGLDAVQPAAGFYSIATQVGVSVFNTTHDPNPIVDELTQIGPIPLERSGNHIYLGASRVPVVGQDPYWELAGFKEGAVERTAGTSVHPPVGDLRTDDVMIVVAQSNGLGAPMLDNPTGWTLIEGVSGPNVYGHQPVTISTSLAQDALAGSTVLVLNMTIATGLPDPPLIVTVDSETLTATTYYVGDLGWVELALAGATGVDHLGGALVTISAATPLLAQDQYVAAWWKIAEGPPPTIEGPALSTDNPPNVIFPDGDHCSAQLYAVVCDLDNPFSTTWGSPGELAMTRVDFPGATQTLEVADINPEDAITLRGAVFLMVGYTRMFEHPGIPASEEQQDIRYDARPTAIIGPSDIGAIGHLPLFTWDVVGPDSIGCALYLGFRGKRERPVYEKVDGHYAPSLENRGLLPPCAGATTFGSTNAYGDYRLGPGIHFYSENAVIPETVTMIQREGQSGSTAHLRAWVVTTSGGPTVTGYIYQRNTEGVIINQEIWFNVTPTTADQYIDPPSDPHFYNSDNPYCYRVDLGPYTFENETYFGLNVWSEEFCQEPGVGVFGLGAGFRYKAEQLSIASNQQASIVG